MEVDWGQGVPLMAGPNQIGLYDPSPETVEFWNGIRAEKLMIKRCATCAKYHHPRRLFCTACDADTFKWVEAQGTGRVYTFSTVHRAPRPEFDADVPYTVGLLELAEGIYFFSRIVPRPGANVRIGAPVRMRFAETGPSGRLPQFEITE